MTLDVKTCCVCGAFMPIGSPDWCEACSQPAPCPMGCGRTTDDVADGPCSTCWEEADRG